MLLSALVVGARGFVGSTYNFAAPLYAGIIRAFEAGELAEARRLQRLAVALIRHLYRFPFHAAAKEILKMIGLDLGVCRLPHPRLTAEDARELRRGLEDLGYFDWGRPSRGGTRRRGAT
jgi:N-acetylneuraminate lyase